MSSALVIFLEAQNEAGVEAAVMRIPVFEPGEGIRCRFPQGQKRFPYRFEPVATLRGQVMPWLFHSSCLTGGMAFMAGNQFQFRTVDEDFPFGGLESQDVGDEGEGHGIEVGLKLDKTLG